MIDIPESEGDPVVIRVVLQPLVAWLWIGGGLMAFGTFLAAFPGRRRDPTQPTSAPLHDEPDPVVPPAPTERTDEPVGVS